MPTYTDSLGFRKGSAAIPADGVHNSSVVSVTLDFPKIIAARAAASMPALAAGDVLEVIAVPAGTIVRNVALVIVTPDLSGATLDVGDGVNPSGYLAARPVSSSGIFGGVPTISGGAFSPAFSGGKVYTTNDTIDVKFNGAVPTNAVVRVVAEFVNINA